MDSSEPQAGSFVVQYVGEVITSEEAEERGKKYDAGTRDVHQIIPIRLLNTCLPINHSTFRKHLDHTSSPLSLLETKDILEITQVTVL